MAYIFTGWELVLALDIVFLILFGVRFHKTRVQAYLFLILSIILTVAVDSLEIGYAARWFDIILNPTTSNAPTTSLPSDAIIYLTFNLSLNVLANLMFDLVVLALLRTWLQSVEHAERPNASRKATSLRITGYLRFILPVASMLYILFYTLSISVKDQISWGTLVVGIAYVIANTMQLVITLWLWSDARHSLDNESLVQKRNQIIVLVGLTFFGSGISYLGVGGLGDRNVVWWLVRCLVAGWTDALVDYDKPPKQGKGGMTQATFGK